MWKMSPLFFEGIRSPFSFTFPVRVEPFECLFPFEEINLPFNLLPVFFRRLFAFSPFRLIEVGCLRSFPTLTQWFDLDHLSFLSFEKNLFLSLLFQD